MRLKCTPSWLRGPVRSFSTSSYLQKSRRDHDIAPTNPDEAASSKPTPPSHGLPRPPFLNPAMQAARSRHKHSKKKQHPSEQTPFQRALALNSYAQALATPVRLCAATESLLPRHQLQSFITVFAPPPSATPDPATPDHTSAPAIPDPKCSNGHQQLIPHLLPEPSNALNSQLKRSYALSSHTLLTQLSASQSEPFKPPRPRFARARKSKAWHRLISPDTLTKYGLEDRNAWVPDPTTAEKVLDGLRAEVERLWAPFFGARRPKAFGRVDGLAVGNGESEDRGVRTGRLRIVDAEEVMCFLSFETGDAAAVHKNVELWTRRTGRGYVQVFDLVALLGLERAIALRTDRAIFRDGRVLAVKKSSLVMNAVLALMKLDAHLDDRPRNNRRRNDRHE